MSFLLAAPELRLRINGVLVGYATGLSYRISQGQKPIFGVDSPLPQELSQGAAPSMIEGSIIVVRPKGGSPENWQLMTPRTGDGTQETGDVTQTALGSAQYSMIEVFDRQTDQLIIRISYVMFSQQDWQVGAGGLMQGSLSFQGIVAYHSAIGPTSGSFF